MTAKEIFESIDLSQLPKDAADKFRKVEKATKGFTIESEKVNTFMRGAYKKIKESKPTALKNLKVEEKITKKEVKKGKTTEVVENLEYKVKGTKKVSKKTPTPSKPKRSGETAMERARKIRKKGEAWKDALARAQKELKAEATKAKKDAEKVVSTTSQALKNLEKMIQNDPKLKGYPRTYGKQSKRIDANKDAKIKAKPAGKRVSKKGHKNQYGESKGGRVYWENRDNRSDRYAPNFPNKVYLEMGGETDDLGFPTGHTFLVVEVSPDGTKNLIKSTKDYMTALMSSAVARGMKSNKDARVVIVDKEDKKVIHEAFEAGGEITITPTQLINNPDALVGTTTMTELFECGGVTAYQEGGEVFVTPNPLLNAGSGDYVAGSNTMSNMFAKGGKLSQEVPKFLYHATYEPLLPSIKKTGLNTSKAKKAWEDSEAGVVYLANDPYVAESYAETSEMVDEDWLDQIVILKVDSKDLDLSKLQDDRNVRSDEPSDTFEYHGVIPWKKLKVHMAKGGQVATELTREPTIRTKSLAKLEKLNFDKWTNLVADEIVRLVRYNKFNDLVFGKRKTFGFNDATYYINQYPHYDGILELYTNRVVPEDVAVLLMEKYRERSEFINDADVEMLVEMKPKPKKNKAKSNTKSLSPDDLDFLEEEIFAKGGKLPKNIKYYGVNEIKEYRLKNGDKIDPSQVFVHSGVYVSATKTMKPKEKEFQQQLEFASGGKINWKEDYDYIPRYEIEEVELENGKVIKGDYVVSGIYKPKSDRTKKLEKEMKARMKKMETGGTIVAADPSAAMEDLNQTYGYESVYAKGGNLKRFDDKIADLSDDLENTKDTIGETQEFLRDIYGKEMTYQDRLDNRFEKGGRLGFEGLAKKVAKRYEGKPVKAKYQDEYGKTYSKEEALEVGRKVAAKVYGQQQANMKKMAKGGVVNASRTAMEIGALTGLNKNVIQDFVDKNNLDIERLYKSVKNGSLSERMDFVTAVVGSPNNTNQKKIINAFGATTGTMAKGGYLVRFEDEGKYETQKFATLDKAKDFYNFISEQKMNYGPQKTQLISNEDGKVLMGAKDLPQLAKGGSLDGHGLQLGDKIVEDLGSVLKITTKDGGMVYVDLGSGYRGKDMPLPFEKGGAVGGMKIPDIAKKFGKTTADVMKQVEIGAKHEMEHTSDAKKARKIALDHLSGDLDYYTKLNKLGL